MKVYGEKQKAYQKEYNQRPEVKKRLKEWNKEYNSRPEIKKHKLIQQREYSERPEVKVRRKEYIKEYERKLEVKERRKQLKKKPIRKESIKKYKKEYMQKRKQQDTEFAIRERLRTRLRHAIIYYIKNNKYKINKEELVDYKAIIESLKPFPKDISSYHIDHIKPLCSFDLTKEEQIKEAFAPKNHQWLLAKDNIIKGGKYE